MKNMDWMDGWTVLHILLFLAYVLWGDFSRIEICNSYKSFRLMMVTVRLRPSICKPENLFPRQEIVTVTLWPKRYPLHCDWIPRRKFELTDRRAVGACTFQASHSVEHMYKRPIASVTIPITFCKLQIICTLKVLKPSSTFNSAVIPFISRHN
jgi:hypothetical protein